VRSEGIFSGVESPNLAAIRIHAGSPPQLVKKFCSGHFQVEQAVRPRAFADWPWIVDLSESTAFEVCV
jgi:hypothetical protein